MYLILELMPATRRRHREWPLDIMSPRFERRMRRRLRRRGWLVARMWTETDD